MIAEITTKLGHIIPENIRGIVYFCHLDDDKHLTVLREVLCEDAFEAMNLYANTNNPESQMVDANTHAELLAKVFELNQNIEDPKWIEGLIETL